MYESATFKDDIVDSPKPNIDTSIELNDIDYIGIDYANLTTPELKEDTFGDRLRKSRLELGLSISQVAKLCEVTDSVISGYECDRYNPTRQVLKLLSSTFNMNYLCIEGYTKLLYNFDEFLNKLKRWMSDNNFTRIESATKIGVSPSLFRFWFNNGTISISTYQKINSNLKKYNLFL